MRTFIFISLFFSFHLAFANVIKCYLKVSTLQSNRLISYTVEPETEILLPRDGIKVAKYVSGFEYVINYENDGTMQGPQKGIVYFSLRKNGAGELLRLGFIDVSQMKEHTNLESDSYEIKNYVSDGITFKEEIKLVCKSLSNTDALIELYNKVSLDHK